MNYEIITCPFCEKGDISCYYMPSVWSQKSSGRNALGRGVSVHKSQEQLIVREDCKTCGKTIKEIQEWLRR